MKKRILTLALALLLCVALLPSAALAAGERTQFNCGDFVMILDGFLRTEEFDGTTVFVVADNTDCTIEAAPGKSYWIGGTHYDPDAIPGVTTIAFTVLWDCQRGKFVEQYGGDYDAQGPDTYTVEPQDYPSDIIKMSDVCGIVVAESDAIHMAQGALGGAFSMDGDTLYHYNGTDTNVVLPAETWQVHPGAFEWDNEIVTLTLPGAIRDLRFLDHCEFKSLTDIYFCGSKGQWDRMTDGEDYQCLDHVTVHCASALPATQTVLVDGKPAELQAYALADSNGNLTNYVKARDVAMLLNGTNAQFEVGWNQEQQAVDLAPGKPYTPNGSEMSTPFSGEQDYDVFLGETTYKGWYPMGLNAIQITDANGGGYTYYKLRDLGQALHFNVGWAADKGVYIETDKSYDPAN